MDSNPKPIDNPPPGARLVKNPVDVALSWDYNLGAKEATGDYVLNMQQDCVPEDKGALERMFKQLHEMPRSRVRRAAVPHSRRARHHRGQQSQ